MPLSSNLPHPKRFITTHDPETGKAIVSNKIDSDAPFYSLGDNVAHFALCYATTGFPVNLNDETDIDYYSSQLASPPGLVVSSGTVLRYVDMAPGKTSPMHRTVSLDFGVVLEGEVELVLDSGETRPMKRGDICVQRGTNHAWRNMSERNWARMLYVLQPSQPVLMDGKTLGEDLGGMQGVRDSS